MKLLFLTIIKINSLEERGIYTDLLRKFRDEGHEVFVVSPTERRYKESSGVKLEKGVTLLQVKTLNLQKTNIIEKGIGTLSMEYQFLRAIKNQFSDQKFDLVLYSTPPITFTKVVDYIKRETNAVSYLLLKDIFPQNAVDLGMIKKHDFLHRFFTKKEKQLYACSDFIGCMSTANVEFLIKNNPELNPDKVEVNPNSIAPVINHFGIEEKLILRNKYKIPDDTTVFMYGGNLGKPQGVEFLIKVLESNLNKKKIYFVIVGGGRMYNVINGWYKKNKPSNALLLQSLPKAEYDELVRVCDVGLIFLDKRFTIPNFPSRLLSYLENKMPVLAATDISTDIGKVIEDNRCGFWCESGNLAGFNNHLNYFVTNRNLIEEMGENAYQLLLNNYIVDVSYNCIINKVNHK